MNVLWLSPRWPWPDNTGARKATMALLSELVNAAENPSVPGFQLHLVCLYENQEDLQTVKILEELTHTKDNLYLERPPVAGGSNGLAYLLTRIFHPQIPFTIQKYSSRSLRAQMEAWMKDRKFDVTVIDGLHGAAFIDFGNPGYGRFLYRAHNVESELWRQMEAQEKNSVKKWIWRLEHRLSERFENEVCRRSEKTFAVSVVDSQKFKALLPESAVESLAIGAAIESLPLPFPASSSVLRLLFVGRLDWEPNKKGLAWFLKEVWPTVSQQRSVELTIIGSGDSDWLSPYANSHLRILRNVPELASYYRECHLTLIPLFMGSGTRVKAIESGNFGRSFVATRIGVEGLPYEPGRDYWQVESSQEWIELLGNLHLSEAQRLGENAHLVTKNHFDKRSLATQLLSVIVNLRSSSVQQKGEHVEIPASQSFPVS